MKSILKNLHLIIPSLLTIVTICISYQILLTIKPINHAILEPRLIINDSLKPDIRKISLENIGRGKAQNIMVQIFFDNKLITDKQEWIDGIYNATNTGISTYIYSLPHKSLYPKESKDLFIFSIDSEKFPILSFRTPKKLIDNAKIRSGIVRNIKFVITYNDVLGSTFKIEKELLSSLYFILEGYNTNYLGPSKK